MNPLRRLPWIPAAILLLAPLAEADGFHSPLLHNSDPHTWADSVRARLGIDRSESAEEGTAARSVPPNMVNQLVDVLKYLRSKNVLLNEFPNFNYKAIPGFLSETESLLIAIGRDAVPLLVSTLAADQSIPPNSVGMQRNADFQERLIRILIAIGEDALDHVMQVAKTAGPKTRTVLLRVIKGIAPDTDFGDDIEDWLKWYDVWKAGQDRRAGAVPALLAHLADEDFRIRLAAIRALGRIRNRLAVPGLRTSLMEEKNEAVRRAAIRALVRIGDLAVVPDLILLLDNPSVKMREEAVTGLRFLSRLARGFDPEGSREDRAEAIELWWAWWRTVERK